MRQRSKDHTKMKYLVGCKEVIKPPRGPALRYTIGTGRYTVPLDLHGLDVIMIGKEEEKYPLY
jgi:hypothetical protein